MKTTSIILGILLLALPQIAMAANSGDDETVSETQFRVEIQDADTSLVQDIDPANSHFQVTARKGDTYQIFSFHDATEAQQPSDKVQTKDLSTCAASAAVACGAGNVASVDYEEHWFGSCCSFTCQGGGGPGDPTEM